MLKQESHHNYNATLPKIAQRKARKEVKYQQHEAASYAYKIVSIDPNFEAPLKMYVVVDDPTLPKQIDERCGQYLQRVYQEAQGNAFH